MRGNRVGKKSSRDIDVYIVRTDEIILECIELRVNCHRDGSIIKIAAAIYDRTIQYPPSLHHHHIEVEEEELFVLLDSIIGKSFVPSSSI